MKVLFLWLSLQVLWHSEWWQTVIYIIRGCTHISISYFGLLWTTHPPEVYEIYFSCPPPSWYKKYQTWTSEIYNAKMQNSLPKLAPFWPWPPHVIIEIYFQGPPTLYPWYRYMCTAPYCHYRAIIAQQGESIGELYITFIK